MAGFNAHFSSVVGAVRVFNAKSPAAGGRAAFRFAPLWRVPTWCRRVGTRQSGRMAAARPPPGGGTPRDIVPPRGTASWCVSQKSKTIESGRSCTKKCALATTFDGFLLQIWCDCATFVCKTANLLTREI